MPTVVPERFPIEAAGAGSGVVAANGSGVGAPEGEGSGVAGAVGVAAAIPQSAELFEFSRTETEEGIAFTASFHGAEVWSDLFGRSGSFKTDSEGPRSTGPVQFGESLWACVGNTLLEIAPQSGAVRRRGTLPGFCSTLDVTDGRLTLTARSTESSFPWNQVLTIDPSVELPWNLSGSATSAFMAHTDAKRELRAVLFRLGRQTERPEEEAWLKSEEARPLVERAAELLSQAAAHDRTNPWFEFEAGRLLADAGDKTGAMTHFALALTVEPSGRREFVALSTELEPYAPDLAQRAFEVGFADFTTHGYRPEQMAGVIGVIAYFGKLGVLADRGDMTLESWTRIGERVWAFSPHAEGAALFFEGLAVRHREAGAETESNKWHDRAVDALPYAGLGGASGDAAISGHSLTVYLAGLIALGLLIVARLLRPTGASTPGKIARKLLMLATWSRGELLGFVAVLALSAFAHAATMRGVATIGVMAAAPIDVALGQPGLPGAVDYWRRGGAEGGGALMYGYQLHSAGRYTEALAAYALGDGHLGKGNVEAAREGRPPDEHPDHHDINQAWRARVATADNAPGLFSLLDLVSALDEGPDLALFGLFVYVVAAVVLVSLLGRLIGRSGDPVATTVGWPEKIAALIVPGAARRWGGGGAFIATAFVFSGLVAWSLSISNGEALNILSALSVPAWGKYYGISAPLQSSSDHAIALLSNLWWILLTLNAVVVLLPERRRPE